MASKKRRIHQGDHGAPWHAVVWITATVLVLSLSTMTLAALAQGTSSGFPKTVTGILQSLTELRRETRDLGTRIVQIEAKMKSRGLIRANANTVTKPTDTPNSASPGNNLSRGEEPKPEPEPTAPAKTQSPNNVTTPTPQQPPVTVKEVVPQPDPVKEKNLLVCQQQCTTAYNACVKATNETPVTSNYKGDDPICIWNYEKECNALCIDWYFYPVPAKPPVPPIESAAQACLLNCRTSMATCFKNAGKDQNKLNYCVLVEDKQCRSGCTAMNENSKY